MEKVDEELERLANTFQNIDDTLKNIEKSILQNDVLIFAKGGVPTDVAADVFGKSEMWVREMIHNGMLPIGIAMPAEGKTKKNVYISPKLLYEYTGYVYRGKES